MTQTDGTSGFFGDLPYFSPVEVLKFYSALRHSSCVHKSREKLMCSWLDPLFFVSDSSSLFSKLCDKSQRNRIANHFPKFNFFPSGKSVFRSDNSNFVSIIRGGSRCLDSKDLRKNVDLDVNGIDLIWTEIIKYVFGDSTAIPQFLLRNCDLILGSPSGSYLFSILMSGIASIIHTLRAQDKGNDRINDISIQLHVLDTSTGRSSRDTIHWYMENSLCLCTDETCASNFNSEYEKNIENLIEKFDELEDWREEIRSAAVDSFEDLCDSEGVVSSGLFKSPVVLLILPEKLEAGIIKRKILDSYTSVPIRIIDCNLIELAISDVLGNSEPLIATCSSSWICEQSSIFSSNDRVLDKMNLKRVIHCGYIEYGENIEEELMSCLSLLPGRLFEEKKINALVRESQFMFTAGIKTQDELTTPEISVADSLLLLSRRFVMRSSLGSSDSQLRLRFSENLFVNGSACDLHQKLINFLEMCGAVKIVSGTEDIELTAIGRFLSFGFRYSTEYLYNKRFSILDAKIVMWAFILRQSEALAVKLVQRNHILYDWVPEWVKEFANMLNISLERNGKLDNESLVTHLSSCGVKSPEELNRLYYILSLPAGKRDKIQNHFLQHLPTECRGWYPCGGPTESSTVSTYAYPPSAVFCEITSTLISSKQKAIQCPLEMSYPLLVIRGVLHISFHNCCVFLETEGFSPIPLPSEILDLMKSILSSDTFSNSGDWLDSIMKSGPLIPSKDSLLPKKYKGEIFTYDFTSGTYRKKRLREASDSKDTEEKKVFSGRTPRKAAEELAISEIVKMAKTDREKAEKYFRGEKGFEFLDPTHYLHPYYLFLLEKS